MEQTALYDGAQEVLQKASLIHNLAEVIFATDPHDLDHKQMASLISDEAGGLIRYATSLSDEIEREKRQATV
jgi:hypothetical protein